MNQEAKLMEGKIAIITGAGRGIGRATATLFAERGARVVAVARTESELESLAAETGAEYVVGTVGTPEGCTRIIQETRERIGPIDILVNNAGVALKEDPVWDLDPHIWHETFNINVHAPFLLTKLAVTDMLERRWGRIVMISSTAGQTQGISAAASAYAASKHAVLGLMRVVALEVARYNVTCNAVLPGWVRTSMSEELARREGEEQGVSVETILQQYESIYSAGRMPTADEIAQTIAFLASEEASGINGDGIVVALEGRG